MKRVYQSSDYYSAQLIKSLLEDNGIEANVTGELLIGAIGEIPANSYPAVWVVADEDKDKAKRLIKEYETQIQQTDANAETWICPECSERIDPQFSQCWNCGYVRSE